MSHVKYNERFVRAGSATVVNGVIQIRDSRGVIRWSNSAADRPDADRDKFNLNNGRVHHLEVVIASRYGGPCDCDGDYDAYLSVAFNAIALSCRMRGWKSSVGPLVKWARYWLPMADAEAVQAIALVVINKPRKMTAATAGRLIRLTYQEWKTLGIKFIDPFDMRASLVAEEKRAVRRTIDKEKKAKARRELKVPTREEISSKSLRLFCERHGISERSFRAARAKGPAAQAKFLAKRGITENLPLNGVTLVREPILMLRREAAAFSKSSQAVAPSARKGPSGKRSSGYDAVAFEAAILLAFRQDQRSFLGSSLKRAADQVRRPSGATTRADGPLRAEEKGGRHA